MIAAPERSEAAEYYFRYIDLVPAGDILTTLEDQLPETLGLLRSIPSERSFHRYAPGKWSIRDLVNHLCDTERLFVFRAFWFARGFESPLPSFDQGVAAAGHLIHHTTILRERYLAS
ncbi:MAG: DinB family protein [Gemmatimonadales bacterium]